MGYLASNCHCFCPSAISLPVYTDLRSYVRFFREDLIHLIAMRNLIWSQSGESNPGPPDKKPPLCHLSHRNTQSDQIWNQRGFDPTTFRSWGERAANSALIQFLCQPDVGFWIVCLCEKSLVTKLECL